MGTLPVDRILTHAPDQLVKNVMVADVLTLSPLEDVGDAASRLRERYATSLVHQLLTKADDWWARLTVNEVVDIIREESDGRSFRRRRFG